MFASNILLKLLPIKQHVTSYEAKYETEKENIYIIGHYKNI